MRLVFVVSCLAPGTDGVGDYARNLATECQAQGHACRLLALNDPYVTGVVEQPQSTRGRSVECLRLSASERWSTRIETARTWMAGFQPDWVSVQFVPYGYQPKGIVLGKARHFARLVDGHHVHVMFHELWLGITRSASLHDRGIGAVQRHGVKHLVSALRPALVQTSNAAYAQILAAAGISAGVLPLFGNIPIMRTTGPDWFSAELAAAGLPKHLSDDRSAFWCFGLFGSLHPQWAAEPLFTRIRQAAHTANRSVAIAAVGRLGPGQGLWDDLAKRYRREFHFLHFGERSAEDISRLLQNFDFGLATTPWQLIEKSGTAAAMADHGLPVIVPRNDVDLRVSGVRQTRNALHYLLDERLTDWLCTTQHSSPQDRLPDVARRFIDDLTRRGP